MLAQERDFRLQQKRSMARVAVMGASVPDLFILKEEIELELDKRLR
jgi:hypothetical protein